MSQTQSGRRYTRVARDEFENKLGSIAHFERVTDADATELVYRVNLPADDLEIRIYSTINPTGFARDCGNDAIRLTIYDTDTDAVIGGRKKTLRLAPTDSNPEGWFGNFRPKLEDLVLNWRDYTHGNCPDCHARLTLRDGQYGEFLGCTNYPVCDHTESA